MIKIYMFTLTEPEWIVNDSFIFIQKFCNFLRDVAEVYVPYSGYVPPQASSLDNLILDKIPNSGDRAKYILHMLRRSTEIGKKIDIFMNVAGHSSLGVLAIISAIRTGRKSIVRVSGNDVEINKINKKILKYIIYAFGERISLKYSTKVLTVSSNLIPYLTEKGADARKIHVISQGVDTTIFKPYQVMRESPTVLFVANRLTPEKRVHDFILVTAEVQKEFPEIKFCIISGEQGIEEAKIFAKKIKANVDFLGYVPNEKLPFYYSSSDVLVVTSSSEALPTVILEAMACGTPVIATNVGGISELVIDGVTGKLVKVGDIEAIKKAVIELCLDDRKRRKLGRNARKFIEENHSYDAIRRKYIRLVEVTLNEE